MFYRISWAYEYFQQYDAPVVVVRLRKTGFENRCKLKEISSRTKLLLLVGCVFDPPFSKFPNPDKFKRLLKFCLDTRAAGVIIDSWDAPPGGAGFKVLPSIYFLILREFCERYRG